MPLVADRNTPERSADAVIVPVKGGAKIYAGALVALAAGLAVPGSTALNLTGLGRAEAPADNSAGNDGDLAVRVGRRVYRFDNSAAADAITAADIGKQAYIVDDATVAKTNGTNTRSAAGTIFDVDADGVWISFR